MKKSICITLAVVSLVSIIIASIISRIMWLDVRRSVLEGLLCAVVFSIPFFNPRIQQLVLSLSSTQKKGLFVFLFLFFTFQCVNIGRTTFPFIPWNMFSKTVLSEKVEFFEYIGFTKDGRQALIKPALIFPSLNNSRIVTDMDNRMKFLLVEKQKLMDKIDDDEVSEVMADRQRKSSLKNFLNKIRKHLVNEHEPGIEEQAVQLNEMLIALGQMYNHLNPKNQLDSINVIRGELSINDKPVPKILRQVIWQVQIP